MSLNWNFEKTPAWQHAETQADKESVHVWAQCFAFYGMACDFGQITERNVEDVYVRIATFDRLFGPFLTIRGESHAMTPDDVRSFIGFTCNVVTKPAPGVLSRLAKQFGKEQRSAFQRSGDDPREVKAS